MLLQAGADPDEVVVSDASSYRPMLLTPEAKLCTPFSGSVGRIGPVPCFALIRRYNSLSEGSRLVIDFQQLTDDFHLLARHLRAAVAMHSQTHTSHDSGSERMFLACSPYLVDQYQQRLDESVF